jgi:hypothetical protein
MTAQEIADQYAQLAANRDKLREKASIHGARVESLTAERRALSIGGEIKAGNDQKAAALTERIRAAADEQSSVQGSIGQLEQEMSVLAVQQQEEEARVAREQKSQAFAIARDRAEFTRKSAHDILRTFVLETFPALMRNQRGAAEAARAAAATAGQIWQPPDLFFSGVHANIASTLEHAAGVPRGAFGPE